MKKYINPGRSEWPEILQRPMLDNAALRVKVSGILASIRIDGDAAVKDLTQKFDGGALEDNLVTQAEMTAAEASLAPELKDAIRQAAENIQTFHRQQLQPSEIIQTMPGILCWRRNVGIEKVGLYIPGGTAPLFSTILMLAIPAVIAGCKEIVLCSPPDKEGKLHPAILFAAQLVGVTKVFKIGGVQAIGAMAYGTETVPKVHKIFGPGNQYVMCAKMLVQESGVAIDMPAGPSEVCVLADASAEPAFVAADLLSQAEHGPDSQALLITTAQDMIGQVEAEVERQLESLPRKEIATKALSNSKLIFVPDKKDAMDFVNAYAPEHLIISCADAETLGGKVINAGSVFLGNYSPESVGDYASGTNHTLPTNGYAHAYSGVSVDSFVKKITYQKLSQEGLQNIAQTVELMAEAEGLQAHANAVRVRK